MDSGSGERHVTGAAGRSHMPGRQGLAAGQAPRHSAACRRGPGRACLGGQTCVTLRAPAVCHPGLSPVLPTDFRLRPLTALRTLWSQSQCW